MNFSKRITGLRNAKGYSQEELAKQSKVSLKQIQEIEKGAVNIPIDEIIKLCDFFDVELEWLVLGEGVKVIDSNLIAMIDSGAKGGYLENGHDPEFLTKLEFYRIPGFSAGDHRIFNVHGDSMYPIVEEDDFLVCIKVDNIEELSRGVMVVVVTTHDILVKRIRYIKDGEVMLESDNKDYHPFALKLSELKEVWMVKAKITQSFINRTNEQTGDIFKLQDELKYLKLQFKEFKTELEQIQKNLDH